MDNCTTQTRPIADYQTQLYHDLHLGKCIIKLFRIINLGQDQDTVALEDAFCLKGVPPSSDNTSAGMERHFPGVEQHHFSLSILIYQYSVWKGPDECHSLSSSRAHSKLTVCLSVRLSPGGHFMLGGHKEKPLCATLQEQRHWNILFKLINKLG